MSLEDEEKLYDVSVMMLMHTGEFVSNVKQAFSKYGSDDVVLHVRVFGKLPKTIDDMVNLSLWKIGNTNAFDIGEFGLCISEDE